MRVNIWYGAWLRQRLWGLRYGFAAGGGCSESVTVGISILAIVFGTGHVFNYVVEDHVTAGQIAFWTLYTADKTAAGLIYGYARMKHGFWACVVLHVLNNLPFVI